MKVIDGVHRGQKGDIVKSFLGRTVMRVGGKKYRIDKDFTRFKEINRHERRSLGQLILCILLGITLIGIPLAIIVLIFMKEIQWSAGVETSDGKTFIFESNSRSEYNLAKKYFGIGAAAEF